MSIYKIEDCEGEDCWYRSNPDRIKYTETLELCYLLTDDVSRSVVICDMCIEYFTHYCNACGTKMNCLGFSIDDEYYCHKCVNNPDFDGFEITSKEDLEYLESLDDIEIYYKNEDNTKLFISSSDVIKLSHNDRLPKTLLNIIREPIDKIFNNN